MWQYARSFGLGAIGYDSFEWRSGGVCLYVVYERRKQKTSTKHEKKRRRRRRWIQRYIITRGVNPFNFHVYFFSQPLDPDTPSVLHSPVSPLQSIIINQRLRHRPFRQHGRSYTPDVLRVISVYIYKTKTTTTFEKFTWK